MPRDFLVPVDLGGNKITSLGTPTAATDAATKGYVDTQLTGAAMTLISSQTWTTGATVSFASIPQTYRSLMAIGSIASARAAQANTGGRVRWNGLTTLYGFSFDGWIGATKQESALGSQASAYIGQIPAANRAAAVYVCNFECLWPNYARTDTTKSMECRSHFDDGTNAGGYVTHSYNRTNNAAITSLEFRDDVGGNLASPTVISLYGIS